MGWMGHLWPGALPRGARRDCCASLVGQALYLRLFEEPDSWEEYTEWLFERF